MLLRRVAWGSMTLLALLVGAYAVGLMTLPGLRPPFIRERLLLVPFAVYAHLAGGAVAITLWPWQLLAGLRRRAPRVHRWIGRVYLGAILLAGSAGLVLAAYAQGGPVARAGFGLLGVLWLAVSATGYARIRAGDVTAHRRWMLRSVALTLGAVTLRIYLPVALALGIRFEAAYPAIAWLAWVPNLAAVEWFLARSRRRPVPAVAF